mmetsp:Transcript_12828/g.18313  ORF Transcript_12828/g.18313 Transcript_12828/m.18313 type:complete len:83 (-) Transcript_12828:208-456(-)
MRSQSRGGVSVTTRSSSVRSTSRNRRGNNHYNNPKSICSSRSGSPSPCDHHSTVGTLGMNSAYNCSMYSLRSMSRTPDANNS